jgi:hypothetical protein
MKLWCSIDQEQCEESSEEDAASEAEAAQGGRMWDGITDDIKPDQGNVVTSLINTSDVSMTDG